MKIKDSAKYNNGEFTVGLPRDRWDTDHYTIENLDFHLHYQTVRTRHFRTEKLQLSHTGNRTRASWVKARYPSH